MLLEIKTEKSISNEINSKTVDGYLWPKEVPLFVDVVVFFEGSRKLLISYYCYLILCAMISECQPKLSEGGKKKTQMIMNFPIWLGLLCTQISLQKYL